MKEYWYEPSQEILNYRIVVIRWNYETEDGDLEESVDLFTFDGINNIFISKSGGKRLKFKEIKYWYPLPNIYKEQLNERRR